MTKTKGTPLLKMQGIVKEFPGVKALNEAEFDLRRGEVHAILGENGAGKSTLIKVLGGIYIPEKGEIYFNGQKENIYSVHKAQELGVSVIHQELVLVPHMTVVQNMFLGTELTNSKGFVDDAVMEKKAREVLTRLGVNGVDIDVTKEVAEYSVACQQMIEIAKALSWDSCIIVMDEPTAALTQKETEILFELIENLRSKGVAIIYISHRMEELFRISDRVTVMRDGKYIGTRGTAKTDKDELIEMMVGRKLEEFYHTETHYIKDKIFEVKNLSTKSLLKNISFDLRQGEILGLSGIVGAGRTELARALFGIDKIDNGEVYLNGEPLVISDTKSVIDSGVAFVPEDRKEQGLLLKMPVGYNLTLQVLGEFLKGLIWKRKKEEEMIDSSMNRLSIKAYSADQYVSQLSGGNQQKVVISKWLSTKPKVLILDEPTRGVDVCAKAEIYEIIKNLAKQGVAIIMISSELPEIVNISNRVIVMYAGEIRAVLEGKDINQNEIMHFATGNI